MGGYEPETANRSDQIYYAMSNELQNDNKNKEKDQSIWHVSNYTLKHKIAYPLCLLTHKNANEPILHVLGGFNEHSDALSSHYEFKVSQIIGFDNWQRFFMDFNKANINCVFHFIIFCFFLFCFLDCHIYVV